jgi:DNA-directed RNA polymerase specialized sigma24 family protein
MSTFEKAKIRQMAATTETDWAAVYEELLPKVYRYFCLRLGDQLEAEDLAATTFEHAWRDRERYRKDLGTFTNWLFGIAGHVAITHFRKHKQEQECTRKWKSEVNSPTRPLFRVHKPPAANTCTALSFLTY